MLHTITTKQLIKSDMDTVWGFMSSPKNLAVVTPDYMKFEVLTKNLKEKMYQGQIIEYYVRPLMNVKLHWVTEITHVEDKHYFVDEQRFGPYQFWHHQHHFEQTNSGVLMTDIVHYKLPLGFIGNIGNSLFVKNQIKKVFDYRFEAVEKIFNQK